MQSIQDEGRCFYRLKLDAVIRGEVASATHFFAKQTTSRGEARKAILGNARNPVECLRSCMKRILMIMLTTSFPQYADEEHVKLEVLHILARRNDDALATTFLN